ncbi:hormogonium polysaccharide biosynthesis protein HpsA [Leptothoe sp. LEGE 181152]|nr:hormogonium polysaccharide biosynthesis protein HpsA [Leptothoe sp. LEGE 181152]
MKRFRVPVPNRHSLNYYIGRIPKRFMAWVLRLAFMGARFSRTRQAGFVLPTTVMLLLVLTLTVGGLSFRSFNRAAQTIAYREQQQIDNFAAPAVDRAKAKIEYLFTKDPEVINKRPPSSSDLINSLLKYSRPLADGGYGQTWGAANQANDDPYTLPDETQLDINDDGNPDPAWSFESRDGNTIVYSILTSHEARDSDGDIIQDSDGNELTLTSNQVDEKADNLVTRNGPINTQQSVDGCPVSTLAGDGWQDAGGTLQKVFQIDVLNIANPNNINRTVSSAEYQQVRTIPKGNVYGAWFRYDMEIFPGGDFRWNGAMHSESNIIAFENLEAYLVSSPESCVFSTDASEISLSVSGYDTDGDGTDDQFFQGHLISGASRDDDFGGNTEFHKENNATPTNPGKNNLKDDTDSVDETGGTDVTDVAVDPVLILTEDITVNLDDTSWDPEAAKDALSPNPLEPNDQVQLLSDSSRVRVFPDAARPFVDDGFRADNRYGPKPRYDSENSLSQANGVYLSTPHQIGDEINDNSVLASDNAAEQEYGLDGYWERRSISQGLRVVVGQRLELGNQFGWEADDPLYPPTTVQNLTRSGGDIEKTPAQAKQQKSLRDNLSAVQGMVVYHYTQGNNGTIPYICAASTVHPGTQQTLTNSRTFNRYEMPDGGTTLPDGTTPSPLETNFLTGKGTNGWEFDFSSFDSDSDGDITDEFVVTRPMGKALRNLAHFAGDPRGGAPSFSPKQGVKNNTIGAVLADDDEVMHPYPYLSMWGDFSILRRIFDEYLDAGTAYDNLSPADKSTLHSAACTLGMLAYNLKAEQNIFDAVLDDTSINWSNLGVKLTQLFDMNNITNGSPIIGRPLPGDSNYKAEGLCKGTQASAPDYTDPDWTGCPSQNPNDITDVSDPEHPQNYFSRFSTDEWIAALVSDGSLSADEAKALDLLITGSQILRDRVLGFNTTSAFQGDVLPAGNYNITTGIWTNPSGSDEVSAGELETGDTLQLGCDPDIFRDGTASSGSKRAQLGLAVVMCAYGNGPKYPSLYYLFPTFDHDHLGADDSLTASIGIDHTQPATEEYINEGGGDIYIADADTGTTKANDGYTYLTVDPTSIALTPKTAASDFNQPTATVAGGTLASRDDLQENIIDANGTITELAFLDKAMMDGRELLSVRVLDLDIDKLTDITADTRSYFTVGTDQISWIPEEDGIFYAAREDAVREDSIVRPRQADWATCQDFANLQDNGQNCPMDVVPEANSPNQKGTYDPPLADNLISPKPVDMYADPDRRPYGFRLINGAIIHRSGDDKAAGVTFVTDNPAYIYGNFNLHQDTSGNILEEFEEQLGTDFATGAGDPFNDFYGRSTLDQDFAQGGQDLWRPAEIFADAVSILSSEFRDGYVEDAYIYETDGSTNTIGDESAQSSYLNSDRPLREDDATWEPSHWQREDLADEQGDSDVSLPIRFNRNGIAAKAQTEGDLSSAYTEFPTTFNGGRANHIQFSDEAERQENLIPAADNTRVNALLVSGIVPLRAGQNYGGLHNFPRLLEYWPGKNLFISGGFFQLNFSTQATAPFDQDSWEPGTTPISTGGNNVYNGFYGAATRIWGYDVGFQYTSVAPIARRFVALGRPRSEFYRELPLQDEYIANLCTAEDSTGALVLGADVGCQ